MQLLELPIAAKVTAGVGWREGRDERGRG